MLRPSWVIVTATAGGAALTACAADGGGVAAAFDAAAPDAEPDPYPPFPPWRPGYCEGLSFATPQGGMIWVENTIDHEGEPRILATAHFFEPGDTEAGFPNVSEDPETALICNWIGGSGGPGSTFNPAPEGVRYFMDATDEVGATASVGIYGRRYVDVGDTLTIEGDGLDAVELVRHENHVTALGGGSFHPIAYDPFPAGGPGPTVPADRVGGTGDIAGGRELTVTFSGSDEVTATGWTFEEVDGVRFAGVEVPPRPVVTSINGQPVRFSAGRDGEDPGDGSPGEFNQAASIAIDTSQDLTISYDTSSERKADLIGFVAIYQHEPTFEITHLCMHVHPGQLTLPRTVYEQMAPTGSIVVSNLYHRLRTLDCETGVDVVGVSSTSASYRFEVQP